ncbi:fimbria/pilus periplasmic chaperone [Pseudomonas sp. RC4D1]|uniref:fimbria/pilus periplasmic chaperone n=1 Tax=Pseudomonas sp. RC4D1 TaxID=2834407 RepID=UPI001BCE8FCC|nr:fimbria/pilus periplasmic chaperone [Pseudomonas sp. RC4D1]MBS7560111.1 fimbria/pilus periplasmic chaperone [Pseudomonas sp. RC4D1]
MSIISCWKKVLVVSLASSLLLMSKFSHAGGVGLGATRVVYFSDNNQATLSVTNTDQDNVYLVQSWVEGNDKEVAQDFMITPPLFVIKRKSENILRLIYGGAPLAEDRESLFWVNVKAIPSTDKPSVGEEQNMLKLAVVSRIKLFYRPKALAENKLEADKKIQAERKGNHLVINNPTPYFASLVNIAIGKYSLENTMVAPYSEAKISVPESEVGQITYSSINDYGGVTKLK